jgi:phenylpyruvate tautomerase PptA (4-oxalocrotonate tautomerase family)
MKAQYNCIVQERHLPEKMRPDLAAGLKQVTSDVLGIPAGEVEVVFRDIPHGDGWRGGELSTTSLVRGTIPPGCEQPVREQLLRTICDMWSRITDCDEAEVVVSAVDSDYVSKIY